MRQDPETTRRNFLAAGLARHNIVIGDMVRLEALHAETALEAPCALNAEIDLRTKIRIGAFTHINGGYITNVTIGRYCSIARDVQIGHGSHPVDWLSVSPLQYNPDYRGWAKSTASGAVADNVTPRSFGWSAHTIIGNDVWLGNHVFIKDGVKIGDGAIVGAGSVVTHDVAPYAVVAGSPARVIRMRFEDRIVERLLQTKWWRFRLADFGSIDYTDVESAMNRIEDMIALGQVAEYQPGWIGQPEMAQLAAGLPPAGS